MKFLNDENIMPIIGFYGPYACDYVSPKGWENPEYLTDEYFEMIKESGINLISYTENDYAEQPEAVIRSLELAEKYDIGMYVGDSAITGEMSKEEMEQRISEYNQFGSFKGIKVCDEPGSVDYGLRVRKLEDYYEICQKLNSIEGVNAYVNLFAFHPDWIGVDNNTIWLDREHYEAYIDAYCRGCAAKVVSQDYYLFDVHSIADSKDYFENLEIMNLYAQKYNIPYWVHIQLGGQWNDTLDPCESKDYYPHPNEVVWNVNTSLACGAKGIQYFPLLQPIHFAFAPDGEMDFKRNGLITADGKKSFWLDCVKEVNAQIQAVGGYLLQMTLKQMVAKGHYAKLNLPKATTSYCELQEVLLGDECNSYGTIIGCFEYQGSHAFYVVNNDAYNEQDIMLKFDREYSIKMVCKKESRQMQTGICSISLQPAGACLVILEY